MLETYITLFQILRLNVSDVAAEHGLGAAQAGEKPRQDLAPDCGHLHHLPLRQEHSHSLRDLREGSKGMVNATGKMKPLLTPNCDTAECSCLLPDPADRPPSAQHQQQRQLPRVQFRQQQEDIQIHSRHPRQDCRLKQRTKVGWVALNDFIVLYTFFSSM